MTADSNPQLQFWRGSFGDDYIDRNPLSDSMQNARIAMWRRILSALENKPLESILEVGANIGINLAALHELTSATLYALEPNEKARTRLIENAVVPADPT